MSTSGLTDRVLGWLYEALTRRFERRRKESEETRERLRKLHSILTQWSRSFPQFVELLGLMGRVAYNNRMLPNDKIEVIQTIKAPIDALAKTTPDLARFIADNYLLLPPEIGKRLKEIESLGEVTRVALGQEDGKEKAEAIRQKCKELMDLIERDHFKREGG